MNEDRRRSQIELAPERLAQLRRATDHIGRGKLERPLLRPPGAKK